MRILVVQEGQLNYQRLLRILEDEVGSSGEIDLVVLPENCIDLSSVSTVGGESKNAALNEENVVLNFLCDACKKHSVYLVLGSVREVIYGDAPSAQDRIAETCVVIGRKGEVVLQFRKPYSSLDIVLAKAQQQEFDRTSSPRPLSPATSEKSIKSDGIKSPSTSFSPAKTVRNQHGDGKSSLYNPTISMNRSVEQIEIERDARKLEQESMVANSCVTYFTYKARNGVSVGNVGIVFGDAIYERKELFQLCNHHVRPLILLNPSNGCNSYDDSFLNARPDLRRQAMWGIVQRIEQTFVGAYCHLSAKDLKRKDSFWPCPVLRVDQPYPVSMGSSFLCETHRTHCAPTVSSCLFWFAKISLIAHSFSMMSEMRCEISYTRF